VPYRKQVINPSEVSEAPMKGFRYPWSWEYQATQNIFHHSLHLYVHFCGENDGGG
jgi:hypothetical protein